MLSSYTALCSHSHSSYLPQKVQGKTKRWPNDRTKADAESHTTWRQYLRDVNKYNKLLCKRISTNQTIYQFVTLKPQNAAYFILISTKTKQCIFVKMMNEIFHKYKSYQCDFHSSHESLLFTFTICYNHHNKSAGLHLWKLYMFTDCFFVCLFCQLFLCNAIFRFYRQFTICCTFRPWLCLPKT